MYFSPDERSVFKSARDLYAEMGVNFRVKQCEEAIRDIGQMTVAEVNRAPKIGNEPDPDPDRDLHPSERRNNHTVRTVQPERKSEQKLHQSERVNNPPVREIKQERKAEK